LRIPLWDSQGLVIFLFFAWVTSSQAILTLYRLRAGGSWRVAGTMLVTLVLVMSTYLFAAERFTHFLYPEPGVVSAYFRAAALPGGLFDGMIAMTALVATMGWILIYARSHGRSIHLPAWMSGIQTYSYLLLMNRLYLDGLALRAGQSVRRALQRSDQSQLLLPVAAFTALVLATASAVAQATDLSLERMVVVGLVALSLPLFPLHGLYVRVLTRLPGRASMVLSLLLPLAGLYGAVRVLPGLPAALLSGLKLLALFGAVYGSTKALAQVRATKLFAYGGLVFYSILWWHLAVAVAGRVMAQDMIYAGAVALVTFGLRLSWHAVDMRYGDLALDRISGLAQPMPRFATLLALLVMAAVGLPPFGLFSGYLGLLLDPLTSVSVGNSLTLTIILLAWFTASWYVYKLMQRLLFGAHRQDLAYEDLRPAEIAPLVIVLVLLLVLGVVPHEFVAGVDTNALTAWSP
jgi:NADH:ubiquinone oxidoreductase subunit 5 (subunit L)/multisubunit Na+/H+ antiporter MnhA subunit